MSHSFKYWTAIVLLVVRLAVGESVHAMPSVADSVTASSAAADCPQHNEVDPSLEVRFEDFTTSQPDCCKQGSCECPCLHVPCLIDASPAGVFLPDRNLPARIGGTEIEHDRLPDLLRPPA